MVLPCICLGLLGAGCCIWCGYKCAISGRKASKAWPEATYDEFKDVPRLCRLLLAVYEPDISKPIYADKLILENVKRHVKYEDTGGRCPPYILYVDHEVKDITLAIRGLNMANLADYRVLMDNYKGQQRFDGGYVHHGLLKAATFVLDREFDEIRRLAEEHPDYTITFVGHSLGSGVVAMMAVIVRKAAKAAAAAAADRAAMEELGRSGIGFSQESRGESVESRGEGGTEESTREGNGAGASGSSEGGSLPKAKDEKEKGPLLGRKSKEFVLDGKEKEMVIDPRRLRCYCIAPARSTSLNLAVQYADVINSVVLQDDFLPRTSAPIDQILGLAFCLPCLLCYKCVKDTFVSDAHKLRDKRRLYAPGRLFHVLYTKDCSCRILDEPEVKTAVPVDFRFEHLIFSRTTIDDHSLITIEAKTSAAVEALYEKSVATAEAPKEQKMERQASTIMERKNEHRKALERALNLHVANAKDPDDVAADQAEIDVWARGEEPDLLLPTPEGDEAVAAEDGATSGTLTVHEHALTRATSERYKKAANRWKQATATVLATIPSDEEMQLGQPKPAASSQGKWGRLVDELLEMEKDDSDEGEGDMDDPRPAKSVSDTFHGLVRMMTRERSVETKSAPSSQALK